MDFNSTIFSACQQLLMSTCPITGAQQDCWCLSPVGMWARVLLRSTAGAVGRHRNKQEGDRRRSSPVHSDASSPLPLAPLCPLCALRLPVGSVISSYQRVRCRNPLRLERYKQILSKFASQIKYHG